MRRQVSQHVMATPAQKRMVTHDHNPYYLKTYRKIYILSKDVKVILAGAARGNRPAGPAPLRAQAGETQRASA